MNKSKLNIKIIIADYYKEITDPLTKSCIKVLEKNNLKYEILTVPGVYEIPQMIKWKIKSNNYNLFIALGCVIKGQTYHFEVISDSVGKALLDIVNQNKTTLVSNGIINAYNKTQALKRSKNDNKNKGHEAASAMVKMIKCLI